MRMQPARTSAPDAAATPRRSAGARALASGPNAAIQLIAALRAARRAATFSPRAIRQRRARALGSTRPAGGDDRRAGYAARLHIGARATVCRPTAREAALADAGRLTADYLLAHRIPAPLNGAAQGLAARPRPAGCSWRAISRACLDFCRRRDASHPRSGATPSPHPRQSALRGRASRPRRLAIWHAAVFERLFGALDRPDGAGRGSLRARPAATRPAASPCDWARGAAPSTAEIRLEDRRNERRRRSRSSWSIANDRETGYAGKLEAHRQGLRHRAISVCVTDGQGRMLLQRRALRQISFGRAVDERLLHPSPPGEGVKLRPSGGSRRNWA